jgi:hypothetical protein
MIKWFREWRRDIKFTHCFEKAAQQHFDSGEISYKDLEECKRAASSSETMRRSRLRLQATDGRLGGIKDWDWEAIWQWFQDYFIPAMRIIIPMLLILEPNPTPDDE